MESLSVSLGSWLATKPGVCPRIKRRLHVGGHWACAYRKMYLGMRGIALIFFLFPAIFAQLADSTC